MVWSIEYDLRFPTSVYHARESYGNIYVGGSLWNRRKTLYTKEVAQTSEGVLRIITATHGGSPRVIKEIIFPHMVYTVTDLLDGRLFIALKYRSRALTLISADGAVLKQRDDAVGNGSYSVVFDGSRKELVLATRSGRLEFVDSISLQTKQYIQLATPETRLWSLCLDESTGNIYVGDYDGTLYVVESGLNGAVVIGRFDVETLYSNDIRLTQGFKPAVWGLEMVGGGHVLIGTRWGDVILLGRDFEILNRCHFGEDVSCVRRYSDDIFLVGTRYGNVFSFDLKSFKPELLIVHKKPSLQKENAVWTMTTVCGGIIACFADGNVCRITRK